MSDGVPITAGVGTTIATELIGGAHYQIVKLGFGALDTFTEVSVSAGLPVSAPSAALPLQATPGLQQTEDCTRAIISTASSGDQTLIAADATHKIAVMALLLICDSANALKLGETGPTYYTGAMKTTGFFLAEQGKPYFLTSAANKAILLNLASAIQVSGCIWYKLI